MARKQTVRTRKRGKTYSYSFEIGKVNGKRKTKEVGGFETEADAYNAGVEAYNNFKHGNIGLITGKVKCADFMDKWLHQIAKPNIRHSTYEVYYRAIKGLNKYLGDMYLQDIKPCHIDSMVRDMANTLSTSSIKTRKTVLSLAFKFAIYPAELISYNPCTNIKIPNVQHHKVKRTIIDKDCYAKLLPYYPPENKMHILLQILYHTGMRVSEVLGLTWDRIKSDRIIVDRQLLRDDHFRPYFGPPKTDAGEREILIDSKLQKEIKVWKTTQREYEMKRGDAYQLAYEEDGMIRFLPKKIFDKERIDFVVTSKKGLLLSISIVDYHLRKYDLNSHSFRHTHATKLLENGAKAIDIATRLGHNDATSVNEIYGHDTKEMQKQTLQIFEEYVGK